MEAYIFGRNTLKNKNIILILLLIIINLCFQASEFAAAEAAGMFLGSNSSLVSGSEKPSCFLTSSWLLWLLVEGSGPCT